LVLAAATGRWLILPVVTGVGVLYFFCAREWGDAWLRRSMRARPGPSTRLERLAVSEARSANVPAPDVLVSAGAEPNALALALRKRTILVTEACDAMDELPLEGMLAHEVIHLRDGDAAVASLYLVLAGSPELLFRRAGVGVLLAIPLWPVALAMRLGRRIAMPPDREHRADVAAAMLTRYPPGIVDALEEAGGATSGLGLADAFWFAPRNASDEQALARADLVAEM
jgi:Zn-dependent protease with chaperone function